MATPSAPAPAPAPAPGGDPAATQPPAASASSQPPPPPLPPARPFISSPIRPAPIFVAAAPQLLGKPINPPPPPPPPKNILFPVAPRASFPSKASPRPPPASSVTGDQTVTVANPAGYIRSASQTAVMSLAAQPRPFVYTGGGEHGAQGMRSPPPGGQQPVLPFVVPRPVGPPGGSGAPAGTLKTAPLAAHPPKVASFPSISSTTDNNSTKEREKSRDDSVVVINDRKVRLLDGGSGSLYAFCRSWVRNGLPHETQPNFGDGVKLLPKPLPASMVDTYVLQNNEDSNETEDPTKEEHADSVEQLSAHDLLKAHIKRAKSVRAKLRKERLLRIERYKQRLSLLLPPPSEAGRTDNAAGS